MKSSTKYIIGIFLVVLTLSPIIVFATNGEGLSGEFMELQVPLPGVSEGGVKSLGEYVNAAYRFSLSALAMFCVLAFIVGGIIYITSAGNASKTGQARSLMINSVAGLVIALLSYVILATINPALLTLEIKVPETIERIKVCRDNANENDCKANPTCTWLTNSFVCVEQEPGTNCALIKQPNSCRNGCVWLSGEFCGLKEAVEDTTQMGNREAKCSFVKEDACEINTDCEWKKNGCIAQTAVLDNKCLGMPEDQCSPHTCIWTGQTCMPKSGKDEACTFSENCQAGLFCSDATKKCTEKLQNGNECGGLSTELLDSDVVCLTGECAQTDEGFSFKCIQCNANFTPAIDITYIPKFCPSPSENYCNQQYECVPKAELGEYCAANLTADNDAPCVCKSDSCDTDTNKCVTETFTADECD